LGTTAELATFFKVSMSSLRTLKTWNPPEEAGPDSDNVHSVNSSCVSTAAGLGHLKQPRFKILRDCPEIGRLYQNHGIQTS